jgi:hypothetical protein
MRAFVEYDPPSDGHRIWIVSDELPRRVMRFEERGDDSAPWVVWNDHADNTQAPPTLHLPAGALHALMLSAGDILPPSAALDVALTDAKAVRDRLLVLVERFVDHAGIANR